MLGASVLPMLVVLGQFVGTPAHGASVATPVFSNPNPILLPGGDPLDPGPGSPYPSVVQVSGLTNAVSKATVTVRNITHDWPDDIDLLLVGPRGQNVMLMSDCGLDIGVSGVTINFDDEATQSVPDGDPGLSSGTFRPTNEGSLDDLPSPAPPRPFGATLSVFRDTDPNGTWSLYAVDDTPENFGFIADGWTLTLTLGNPIADLAVTLNGPSQAIFVGNNLTYTITVTNRGPAIATAVVQDVLPASQTYVSSSASVGSCANNAGVVTCNIGDLLVGQGAQITLVASPIFGGTYTNVVSVTGNQSELIPTNNAAAFVVSSIGTSDLAVSFDHAAASALIAQPMQYVIVVTNNSLSPASSVTVTNVLPAGFTLLAAVPSQGVCSNQAERISCSLGTIGGGAAATVQISARPNVLGLFTNLASAGTTSTDSAQANNTGQFSVQVVPAADLAIAALAPSTNLVQGQDLVSLFSITNQGPNPTTLQFSDPLPTGFSFVSASTTHGSCTNTGSSLDCSLGTLLSGETALLTVVHRAVLSGSLSNVATVAGAAGDPDVANNSASIVAITAPTVDLALDVTDVSDPVWLGENLVYRIAITNRGPGAATSVMLTNTFPSNFIFIAVGGTQGACARNGNEISCTVGSLPSGAGALVNLTVRPTIVGMFTNATFVNAVEIDPDPQNNFVFQTTRVITSSGTFISGAPITIPEVGPASPYPANLLVSGLTGAISQLRVTLTNLNHTYPDDLDLLLVGPQGQAVLLMSDAGGDFPCINSGLVFDDAAPNFLPDSAQIISGIYRPSNYENNPDTFVPPAPVGPYSTNLAVFRNTNPNGVWTLYIMDDATKDSGSLLGGWGLTFNVTPIVLAIAQSGTNVTLTFATEPDANYLVEYKDDLNDSSWTLLQSVLGTGSAVMVNDALPLTSNRFYRVRLP
jgi:uncharacterized repeat protein (TIGR01451 family)